MLIQKHHLHESDCKQAQQLSKGRKIAAIFSGRADGSAREGVAILVKYDMFGIERNDITFEEACDGKACTASFRVNATVN